MCLTRCGLANSGVIGAELKAVDAETVEAAVCVDTTLGTGVGGCALIYIHTCLPITLQLETRMTPALKVPKAQEMCQNLTAYGSGRFSHLAWTGYKGVPACLNQLSIGHRHVHFTFTKSFISAHFLKKKSSCCCQKCCVNSCKSHLQSRLPTEYGGKG